METVHYGVLVGRYYICIHVSFYFGKGYHHSPSIHGSKYPLVFCCIQSYGYDNGLSSVRDIFSNTENEKLVMF